MFKISTVPSNSLPAALAIVFDDIAPDERLHRVQTVYEQSDVPGLFVAIRRDEIIGAIYSQLRPDKTLLLWPPGLVSEDASVRAALYHRIDHYAEEVGASPIIVFVENRPREELEAAGFEYVSEMLSLVADEVTFPLEWNSGRLSFISGPLESVLENMTPLFERTFEKTNDFPKLVGIVPTASILQSYCEDSGYQPELWFHIRENEQEIGCLILADHAEFGQIELVYMGLFPEHRGKKFAVQIVQFTLWIAKQLGRRMVTVSVDAQNPAAVKAYNRCGFRRWNRKCLYVK